MTTSWNEYFLGLSKHASSKSKDPNTKVGCVIVGADDEVLSTGFNGIPRNVDDRVERLERPEKYLWISHAEENAVAHAARVGTSLKGSTAYVTHFPCHKCARLLIQSGVTKVIYGNGLTNKTNKSDKELSVARQMFGEAQIALDGPYAIY